MNAEDIIKIVKLDSFDIYKFGNSYDIAGIVYSTAQNDKIIALLPEEDFNPYAEIKIMEMTLDEWKKMIRQTDLLETEILQKAADGKQTKIILRKSARQIDQRVAWKVYERDHYECQYCGIHGVPLTIDHLITWESGGATVEGNLVSSCKKCNKIRGNTPIDEWLASDEYKNRSKNAPEYAKQFVKDMAIKCKSVPLMKHKKTR